jgi:glycosyltransferase involved in cell wall biosynthesis
LFVGRFVPAKNLTLLVDAFSRVVEDWPSATLRLIGDGPIKSDIQSKISDRNLQDSIRLEGYIDNNNLPKFYSSSDVFVLSSQRENHPITLLEAMSCGTPVVAPSIGAIPEIVEDERTGLLYPSGSVSELSGAIDRILSDPGLRTSCSRRAREKATNDFDWFKNQAELFELFNRVME